MASGAFRPPSDLAACARSGQHGSSSAATSAATENAAPIAPSARAAESEDRYARDRARETLSLLSVPDRERADEPAVGVLAIAERGAPAPAAAPVGAA